MTAPVRSRIRFIRSPGRNSTSSSGERTGVRIGDYFDRLNREHLIRYHTQRLADLGIVMPSAPVPARA